MDAPSMVKVSGDTLIVTRVISGDQLYFDQEGNKTTNEAIPTNDFKLPNPAASATDLSKFKLELNLDEQKQRYFDDSSEVDQLPQCKIKRNYSCSNCTYFTQNPRRYLTHLRDIHGEKIVINECKQCLYASRHYQKLVRHMKMVHGSTDGINVPANSRRGRGARLKDPNKKKKIFDISDLNFPLDMTNNNPTNFLSSLIGNNAILFAAAQNSFAAAAQNNLAALANNNPTTSTPPSIMEDHTDPHQSDNMSPGPTNTSGLAMNNDLMSDMQKNKPYKCSVCEFTAQNREHLMDHEKNDHEKTKFFRCYKCSYVTHIKARFSKHEKYHSMPLIKCMQCDFRTPYKWNLDRHMKNHGGKGQFKCSTCNFTADIKQSLTVHEMNHHLSPASGPGGLKRRNKVGGTDFLDIDMEDEDDDVDGMSDGPYFLDPYHYQNSSMSDCPSPTLSDSKEGLSIHGPDGASSPKKKRPIPNLIPIQSQPVTSTPVRRSPEPEVVCKIPGNGTVTDFAKLFVAGNLMNDAKDEHSSSAESTSSMNMKRKSSFFHKLCEKLITNVNREDNNLECGCGYVAKSLSDYVLHQNSCGPKEEDEKPMNLSASSSLSGSNRCKYCRQRCKSSADLTAHMQKCTEAQQSSNEDPDEPKFMIQDSDNSEEATVDDPNEPNSMENIVFVWNKLIEQSQMKNGNLKAESDNNQNMNDSGDDDDGSLSPNKRNEMYFGIETASGYGEVTQTLPHAEQLPGATMKKVFKCPHCSFWASTASRFHVHIVGHLNKKPFECSLCSYRSNWRWDITKHIRLKTIRDPSHADAGVLMNDETGRRNYTKYNKYITLMKVPDASNESAKNITKTVVVDLNASKEENSFPLQMERQSPNVISMQHEQQQKLLDYNTMLQICQLNPKLLLQQQLLQQQQHQMLERSLVQPMNLEPKPVENEGQNEAGPKSYKCKKCNFKDSNREVVLEHVKIHYRVTDVQNSPAPMSTQNDQQKDLTTEEIETHYRNTSTTITPVKYIEPIQTTSTSQAAAVTITSVMPNVSTSSISSTTISGMGLRAALNGGTQIGQNVSVNLSNNTTIINNNNNNTNNTSASSSNSNLAIGSGSGGVKTGTLNGEMDEASSKGISGPSWRGTSAPYRCGHCHQQSNWKHVIQRHCRLKHNGNILIELANNQLIGGGNGVDGRHNRRSKKMVMSADPPMMMTMQPKPPVSTTMTLANLNLSPPIQPPKISTMPENKIIDEPVNKIQFYTSPPPQTSVSSIITTPIISSPSQTAPLQLSIPISLPNVPSQISIIPAAQIQQIHQIESKTILLTPTVQLTMPSTSTAVHDIQMPPTSFESMEVSISPENVLHYQQAGLMKKGKRYKCMFCPYVTDSKSQFLYHKSFHKPRGEPFKCSFCSYNVTKKHLLNQHMKMHAEHRPIDVINIDEDEEEEPEVEVKTAESVLDLTNKMEVEKPKPQPIVEEKKIHYCSLCPARYLSMKEIKEHIQMHSENYQYKCNLCTYSAQQESYLRDHKIAHTSYYQEKTKEFQMKYASSRDYPQPKVIVIPPENGEPSHESNLNSDILKWVVLQSDFEAMITPSKLTKTIEEERQSAIENASKINDKNEEAPPPPKMKANNNNEKCPHCPFSTNTNDQLNLHMLHHGGDGVGLGSRLYKCEHCDYSVGQEEQLQDHIKLHFAAILSANNYAADNNNLKLFSNLNMQNNHLKIFAYDKNTKNTDLIYSDDDKHDDEDEENGQEDEDRLGNSSNNNNYNQDNNNDRNKNRNGDFYTDKSSVILNF